MRPLLILDLDETLVHAAPGTRPGVAFRVGPYGVLPRPHLEDFLRQAAAEYELAVWTSSSADYAETMVGEITARSGTRMTFVWARERCTRQLHPETREDYWLKDLRKIRRAGYDLRRVLVVDDTPLKLARSYGNLVLVRPFTGDPADDELRRLGPYLVRLAAEPDFRAIEKRGWRGGA